MKTFITEIQKIDDKGDLTTWCGRRVKAENWDLAQSVCDYRNQREIVIGELIQEIDEEI